MKERVRQEKVREVKPVSKNIVVQKAGNGGGKMTQYKNIDEIPDLATNNSHVRNMSPVDDNFWNVNTMNSNPKPPNAILFNKPSSKLAKAEQECQYFPEFNDKPLRKSAPSRQESIAFNIASSSSDNYENQAHTPPTREIKVRQHNAINNKQNGWSNIADIADNDEDDSFAISPCQNNLSPRARNQGFENDGNSGKFSPNKINMRAQELAKSSYNSDEDDFDIDDEFAPTMNSLSKKSIKPGENHGKMSNNSNNNNSNKYINDHVSAGANAGKSIRRAPLSSAAPQGALPPPPALPCEQRDSQSMSSKEQLYFSKQPRPVQFKPCTLTEYKNSLPTEYQQIPQIKPDLNTDVLRAKRQNAERVKEFAKNLQGVNQQMLRQQPRIPKATEVEDIIKSQQKLASKREKALAFAKNIPKPKPVRQACDDDDQSNDLDQDSSLDGGGGNLYGQSDEVAARLEELCAKHNDRKRQVELIKRSMGM